MKTLFLTALLLLPTLSEAKNETVRSAPPIGREPSRVMAGARFGQFGANEGALSVGANLEYMYSREFGFGFQAHRASYSTEIALGDMKAEFTNTAFTLALMGNYHFVIKKAPAFDPYLTVGVAHSFISAKANFTGPMAELANNLPAVKAKTGKTFLVGAINGRYFIDPNLSVVGSLALGLSTLSVGMDYLF